MFLISGWLFCYEETNRNPSQRLGCQCVDRVVCIYSFCLINGHRLPCCRRHYLPLSKPWHPHQNKLLIKPATIPIMGISKRLIPKHTIIVKIYFINLFWWRWWESNPRPEVLRFEGITAITVPQSGSLF